MAFTTLLMTASMVAIASGNWPAWPVNDMPFPRFPAPMLRFSPLTPPPLLGMPAFPPFLKFPDFPTIPPIAPMPPFPSIADVVKGGTSPNGGTFTGVAVSMKSALKRNEDGTVVQEGGSTIVTNNNGEIKVTQTGKAPPPVVEITNETPLHNFNGPKIKPPSLNKHMNFNFRNIQDFNSKIFEDIQFGPHHPIPEIDPEKIKKHVPGPNETYIGHSVRVFRSSSNNNGQVKHDGSIDIVENVNGRVNHQHIPYRRDGTRP